MKSHFLVPGFLYCLFLISCGGNPAWTRDGESEDAAIQLAEKTCQCIYDVLDAQENISASGVVDEAADWALALQGNTDEEKIVETMKIFDMNPTLSVLVDESECMEPIEEEMFEKGITFEKMKAMLDQNCSLGMFYN